MKDLIDAKSPKLASIVEQTEKVISCRDRISNVNQNLHNLTNEIFDNAIQKEPTPDSTDNNSQFPRHIAAIEELESEIHYLQAQIERIMENFNLPM